MALLFDIGHSDYLPSELKDLVDDNHLVFPAFINAHDHLEFNLFPTLTDKKYSDYMEWGEDLHRSHSEVIKSILRIPLEHRLQFGLLKNLVNGMGGVVHHGAHHKLIKQISDYPVYLNYRYIHSIATDKNWKLKINLSRSPIMIHMGEGTSAKASHEIEQAIRNNFFHKNIIGIHAISLTPEQAKRLNAVIWCPVSNINLYNATLDVNSIKGNTSILFGTDSTLTGSANFWEHLRIVRNRNLIEDAQLFEMVAQHSIEYFQKTKIPNSWIVAKRRENKFLDSFFQINPSDIQLVWINGESWLCDNSLPLKPNESIPLQVGASVKWIKKQLGIVVSQLEKSELKLPLEIKSA
jgi:hypothetical protein